MLLTPAQVCDRFGVDRSTLNRWVAKGLLVAIRPNTRTTRFEEAEVDRFYEASRTGPVAS